MKNIFSIFLVFICVSCLFEKKTKNVDSFYTTGDFGGMPLIPLTKPVQLIYYQEQGEKRWGGEYPDYFKQHLTIDSIFHIGVDKTYVYGKIFERKRKYEEYTFGSSVFVNKYNTGYISIKPMKARKDEIRIYPIDSINKIFILPERWFVINVADSTTEAFFSKIKYKNYLKEKGVSRKMYNIDSINKVYKKTGILPWFPDSIKVKLRK